MYTYTNKDHIRSKFQNGQWVENGRCSYAGDLIVSPTQPSSIPGDLDKNSKLDIFDYNLLVQNFGKTDCGNVVDIDGNCKVDIFDYNILMGNFGKSQ